jgi:hypothetical protein
LVGLVVLAIGLAACGSADRSPAPSATSSPAPVSVVASSSPTPAPTATPTPAPTATPEPTPVKVPSPLTGRLVSPKVARRHPIAVMIDDIRVARPQSGLNSAAVVWHAPAEAGIPRYMAVFTDKYPKWIGPVRSARVYYIAWASEWKAVYAHSGGSPAAKRQLKAKGDGTLVYNADEFRYGGGAFGRIPERRAPHNVYTSGARMHRLGIRLGAEDQDYDPIWTFAPDAPLEARPYGGTIRIRYPQNTVVYRYDRESNRWMRGVTGEKQQIDANDDKPIGPRNVVIMYAQFTNSGDSKGRLDADVIGSGKATVSTNGRTVEGVWKKDSTTAPTQFFTEAGDPIPLTVGQTFIQVVDIGTDVTIKPGSVTPPASPSASPSG